MNHRWVRLPGSLASSLLLATSGIAFPAARMLAQAPTTAVGSTTGNQAATVTITTAGTLSTISVLTQGATFLDYQATSPNSGTHPCTGVAYNVGDTCSVRYSFSPTRPWLRYGGISLSDSSGKLLGNIYLTGRGTGPQVSFPPSATTVPTTLFSGSRLPNSVAIDGNGDVYFADPSTNSVMKAVATSGSVPQNPTVNTIATGFTAPNAVAVDGSGNIFVLDSGSVKEVLAVAGVIPSTPTINTVATGFGNPLGMALDGSGDIYVTDTTAGSVKEVLAVNGVIPASPTIRTLTTTTVVPWGVAVDSSGDVYFTDSQVVKELVALGGVIPGTPTVRTLATVNNVSGLAIDSSGDLYVPDSNDQVVYEVLAVAGSIPNSPSVVTLGTGFAGPVGVAVDASGNIFVADKAGSIGSLKELNVQTSPTLTFTSTAANTTSSDSPMTVTVADNGTDPLVFSVPGAGSANPSPSTGFTVSAGSTCPQVTSITGALSLASSATCTDLINFQPAALGATSGTLTMTDNNLNVTAATQQVPLDAGVSTPVVTVTSLNVTVDTTTTLTAAISYNGLVPTGAVQFKVNGGSAIGATCVGASTPLTCTASYTASSVTVGAYPVVVTLQADISTNAASGSGTLTVLAATPGVTVGTSNGSVAYGTPVTFTAHVTPANGIVPSGAVSFKTTLNLVTTPIPGCTSVSLVSGGGSLTATCVTASLSAGSNTITANLAGDSNFNAASGMTPQTITQATQSITFPQPTTPAINGTTATLTATVNSGLPVSYSVLSGTATLSNSTVTFTTDGTVTLAADRAADANHSAAPQKTVTVNVIGSFIWIQNSDATEIKLYQAGTTAVSGIGTSGLTSTQGGLAFDSSGDAWSVNAGSNVLHFANYLGQSASTSTGGGLSSPVAVAVDGLGNVWVANSGTSSVSEFTNAGAAVSGSAGYAPDTTSTPAGIAIDSSGSVWVSNQGGNSVTEILGAAAPVVMPLVTGVANSTLGTRP